MAQDKIRHFRIKANRDGSYRAYWEPSKTLRADGWRSETLGTNLSTAGLRTARSRAMELNDQVDAWRIGKADNNVGEPSPARRDGPPSMAYLLLKWEKSEEFLSLADKTKAFYRAHLDPLRELLGDLRVDQITAAHIIAVWRVIARVRPRKAEAIVQTGQAAFKWGIKNAGSIGGGFPASVDGSPFNKLGVKATPKKGSLWAPEAIKWFVKTADTWVSKKGIIYHSVGTAVLINEWLAQNTGDIVDLKRAQYTGGAFDFSRSKTKVGAVIPVPESVQQRIREERDRQKEKGIAGMHLLLSEATGLPWKHRNFNSVFAKIRTEAAKEYPDLKNLTFRELRHTGITRMWEAGLPSPLIAAAACLKVKSVEQVIDIYGSRTNKMAAEAIEKRLSFEQTQENK